MDGVSATSEEHTWQLARQAEDDEASCPGESRSVSCEPPSHLYPSAMRDPFLALPAPS
jgi:hypothetical protein